MRRRPPGDLKEDVVLLGGSSNPKMAEEISSLIGVPLAKTKLTRFKDGEIEFNLNESVRGKDAFIIQSTSKPSNDNLMELLIMVDSLKRASVGSITAVIPYYGYARQDRKAYARDPITAKLVANLLEAAGVDRVVTMDLHAPQIQGFFDIPVDHLAGGNRLTDYFNGEDLDDVIVVAPDAGSVKRTRKLADKLNCRLAIIDKSRSAPNEAEVHEIIGDVNGKNCIMIDDIIDTGGTIIKGAEELKKRGAKSIRVGCTHGVLSGEAIERLNEAPIDEVVCLNTIDIPEEELPEKFKVISVADMFAQAIGYIHNDISLTSAFDEQEYI